MSSVTFGVRSEGRGGLRFGALATEPVACLFLTKACMALFVGRSLPGNLLPKISRVSLMEPVFMYVSTIATLSTTEYVILHITTQYSALNTTFNLTDESRPKTCERGRPGGRCWVGGKWLQRDCWLNVRTLRNIHNNAGKNFARTRKKRRAGYFFLEHPAYLLGGLLAKNFDLIFKEKNTLLAQSIAGP
jgi:hypothetical protein